MADSDSTARPDPVLLRIVAADATAAAETLSRVITKAVTAGLVVDAEVFECSATLTSWAAWVAASAAQQDGT
jgi:hypothetical protein